MEPRYPHFGPGEDPLVARARGRADEFRYGKTRYGMGLTKYLVLGISLAVFALFLGAIGWSMELLETAFKPGEWFGIF